MKKMSSKHILVATTLLLLSLTLVAMAYGYTKVNPLTSQPYGSILQYEWPQYGCDEGQSGFNPGPGPNLPNVLWKAPAPGGSGQVQVFNGKAFVLSSTMLRAYDAFSGQMLWSATLKRAPSGFGTSYTVKIDDAYLMVWGSGPMIYRISDGSYVADLYIPNYSRMPGSGQYFWGAYSSELKMAYVTIYDNATKTGKVLGVSIADPTNPKIAWEYTADEASEVLTCGGGKVFLGTTQDAIYALDGRTGKLLWRTYKTGLAQQSALYYEGKLYHAATSQFMTCIDAETGKILWEYDSRKLGERAFYAYKGAAAYGRVYDACVTSYPNGWVICWDAETGEVLWKQPAYYNIAYNTIAVADGKVYVGTCDSAPGSTSGGLTMPGYSTSCYDAFTGQLIWTIKGIYVAHPVIAYGNLYFVSGGYLYCIGDTTSPWSYGLHGPSLTLPRVAVGQSGPKNLTSPRWIYKTGGPVSSSPAVVDGKVYIGSQDGNWYCLDAYTGQKIWNFTVGYKVFSSPAVIDGKVYTGADDGYFYCLDAETGQRIWKTPAGGLRTNIIWAGEYQPRSSPIVVGGKVYAGSLDGKIYCLRASDGQVLWTYQTNGPIGGSPAYYNGVIYITSSDGYLYALDANTGGLIWKSEQTLNFYVGIPFYSDLWCAFTPNVIDGVVYIGGGVMYGVAIPGVNYAALGHPTPAGANGGGIRFAAFNATNGKLIYCVARVGNTEPWYVPTYFNGKIYAPEYGYATCMNASNPNSGPVQVGGFGGERVNRLWAQWIGYQTFTSFTYADDINGPVIYLGTALGAVTCLNATSGKPISSYQTGGNVHSSPALWEGKLYIGSNDGCIYCFSDEPVYRPSIVAWCDWSSAYVGENIVVHSRLLPGMPNETLVLTLVKPDGSKMDIKASTDLYGWADFNFKVDAAGDWTWTVWYNGKDKGYVEYASSYSETVPLKVMAPSTPTGETAETTPTTKAAELDYTPYLMAIIIAIVISIIIGLANLVKLVKKT